MYRGRVGYEAIPQPFLRNLELTRLKQLHKSKISNINTRTSGSGTLDHTLPETSTMRHLQLRQKKKQMIAERNDEIARSNRHLLQKITKIITTEDHEAADGGNTPTKSLNAIRRSKELNRISKANKSILKRMMNVKVS